MNEATERTAFMMYFSDCTKFNAKGFDMMIPRVLTYALKYGLEDTDMVTITKVAFEGRLSYLRIKYFMKCLIPRIYVPNEVAELVVRYLLDRFSDKEVPIILNYILHWLTGILKYKLILTKQSIYNYYDKFYDLLTCEPIAMATCRLLYLLTSPEDVNRIYAEKLLKLHSIYKLKDKNHFGVLLRLFKCYKPDVVPDCIPYYSVNKHLGTISNGINQSLVSATVRIRNNYKIVRGLQALLWDKKFYQHIVLKRSEMELVPEMEECYISNYHIQNLILSGIVLSTLYNYRFASKDEPTSILCLLNQFPTRVMIALGDEIVQIRFCIELMVVLKDAFFLRKQVIPIEVKSDLLMKVALLQNEMHQAIPSMTDFLQDYLEVWNGIDHQNTMLNLFEWLHIKSYATFYEKILLRLKAIFEFSTIQVKSMILFSLACFIENAMKFRARIINGDKILFLEESQNMDFGILFRDILKFFQNICINAITQEEGHPAVMQTIKLVHNKIFKAGKKVLVKDIPACSVIEYWPAFEADYKMLFRISELQKNNDNIKTL